MEHGSVNEGCNGSCANSGSDRIVCSCLRVSEGTVTEAIRRYGFTTVKEIRQFTGAGDGCTACCQRLQECLEPFLPLPLGERVGARGLTL